jgi:hypothetical protein
VSRGSDISGGLRTGARISSGGGAIGVRVRGFTGVSVRGLTGVSVVVFREQRRVEDGVPGTAAAENRDETGILPDVNARIRHVANTGCFGMLLQRHQCLLVAESCDADA